MKWYMVIEMRSKLIGIGLLTGLLLSSSAAVAQSNVEGRVDRLEREMRAVQRKVFPGGNNQYFPPDIAPSTTNATPAPGTPASTPVADLNGRISAVESQMTTLTGQIEQNQYRLQQFEEAFAAYKRTTDARLKALEDTASATGGPLGAATLATPAAPKPAATPKPATPPKVTSTAATVAVDPARAGLVAAVEKPSSDDPADDLYVYGYRLWQAKLYPEAAVQLKQVVAKYPTNRRASWAQNLLGRTYLDDGKPSLASLAFYDNYKKFPDGERAPDSLYFLTVALKKLGKPSADICQVYDELSEVYAAKITAQMKADIARGRVTEKCKAV
jgi:TolA-binding protein